MDRSCADSPPAASPRPEDTAGKDVAAPPTEPVSDTPAGRAEGAAPVASAPQLPGSVVPEKTDAPDVVTLSVRRPARPAAADGSASPSYNVVNVSPLAFQFTAPSADGNAGRVSPLALQFTAPSTEGADLPAADTRTLALRPGAPRRVAPAPSESCEPTEAPRTTTVPVRHGVSPRLEILETVAAAPEPAPDPFFDELPAPPPGPVAPAVESLPPEALCPRCASRLISPESLGLCERCGYCRSLEETRLRGRASDQSGGGRERVSLVEFFEALGQLPEWSWVLLCGVACTVAVSVLGIYLMPPEPPFRAWWSAAQLSVAIAALLVAQAWALILVAPYDDHIGAMSLIFPARVWWLACRRLPATRWPVWLGAWGTASALGAALLVGGLGYWFEDQQFDPSSYQKSFLREPQTFDRALRDASSNLDSRSQKALFAEAGKALESVADLAIDLVKSERKNDDRETTECVVIGYTKKEDGSTNGLILATVRDGALHYAGVVHEGLEEQVDRLGQRLRDLAQRETPIGDTNVVAIWTKPELFVEVHSSGFDEKGTLQEPNLKGAPSPKRK